jgi:hypothetical protein
MAPRQRPEQVARAPTNASPTGRAAAIPGGTADAEARQRAAAPGEERAASASRQAELIRKRYLYRQLILRGRARLPYRAAARLIGPDCAYHLYAHPAGAPPESPDDAEAHSAC